MLNLIFEDEIPEFTLPDGRECLIVGLKLKDIKKGINLQSLQKSLNKLQALEKKSKKDLDLLNKLPDEIFDLMDKIIELGIIDKETKEPIIFPREYRNPNNDMELVQAIMEATQLGGSTEKKQTQKKQLNK